MNIQSGPPKNWQHNAERLSSLLTILNDSAVVLRGWNPRTDFENVSFTFLERIRVNLFACQRLMLDVQEMEIFFLPMGLIMRTIVTDIIVHKYLRAIRVAADKDGVEQELNVIDRDFVKAIRKIFDVLKAANPNQADALTTHFDTAYADYLNEKGKVKNAKELRVNLDVQREIEDFKQRNNIDAPDTDKESGKIDFLLDANKENIKFLYCYLAQLHHYSTKSLLFYKDVDFRSKNIDVAGSVIWLSASTLFEVFSDLFPESNLPMQLKKLAEQMVGEEIPLSTHEGR